MSETENNEPTPTPVPSPTPDVADDEGKGSKQAVLADLANERDRRQKLQAQLDAATGEHETKLTETVAAHAQALAERDRELAVYRNAGNANPAALLDSRSSTDALNSIDTTDQEAVTALIREHLEANPALAAHNQPPAGVGDAGAGTTENIDPDTKGWLDTIFEN